MWNKWAHNGKVRTTLTPYTRRSCELVLLGTRGKVRTMIKNHYVLQFVDVPIPDRRWHSNKPVDVRNRIVDLCSDCQRIELFAREQADGWDALGNEIDGMDIRESLGLLGEYFRSIE